MSRERSGRSRRKPLFGIRVLVGRARHQASVLSKELRALGADVVDIPFIEIRNPRSFTPLDAALKNLASYNWLILTSVNGVEAMWERMKKLRVLPGNAGRDPGKILGLGEARILGNQREGHDFSRAEKRIKSYPTLAVAGLRIAAIGPATKNAIEQRGMRVDVVPKEYVAESVVRSLRRRVKGKRVLLVRAKVARDVIPRELRAAGARVDVVEAYETVVPQTSRKKLLAALKNSQRRPHVVTFTSSSTVRNFLALLGGSRSASRTLQAVGGQECPPHTIRFASIGPVTSSTLRELGLRVDVEASEYTIPGLVQAIVRMTANQNMDRET